MTVTPDDPRPPYLQVAHDLRTAITGGVLKPGEKLPSGRDLSRRYGVALMTVQKALSLLRDEGLVVSYQGRGVFVRSAADQARAASSPEYTALMRRIEELRGAMDQAVAQIDDRLTRLEQATGSPSGPRQRSPAQGSPRSR